MPEVPNVYAAPQAAYERTETENTSGKGKLWPVPPEVPGWSWGAFCLSWIWAIGNRSWIGLLALVPYLGFVVAIVLGVKGREWAWQNKRWDSIEHFNRVQRRWSIWGACVMLIPVLGIMAAVAIPAYSNYTGSRDAFPAFMFAQRQASHVGAYIVKHRQLPASLAEGGLAEPLPPGVRRIVLNQQTAQLEITMDKPPMAGQTFYMAPNFDKDGYIVWRCMHGDVNRRLLPSECRFSAVDPLRLD